MLLHNNYVPAEGPLNARVMCVGEAPSEDEDQEGRPFVGKSGQFLERYLGRTGLSRSDVYFTNLCRYRPKGNQFKFALGTTQLAKGIEELTQEIEAVKPNVIIALGAWPMYYLTGCRSDKKNAEKGSGIFQWRGSTMPCKLVDTRKVYITMHPSHIIRPEGFGKHPIFYNDIKRAIEESSYPEIRYPQYEEYIDPPDDVLSSIVDDFLRSDWLTIDIETAYSDLTCIGFTDSLNRGLCLTMENKSRNWEVAKLLLASKAKKTFQFGHYDVSFLKWHYGWETNNWAFDTYIAANNIMPGFPKKLEFLTSIYTRFPYYKEDRKTWRLKGGLDILWKYNLKDVIATHTIAMQQMEELGWPAMTK